MTIAATEYKHIQLDERGTAFIVGSTMKVIELVTSHRVQGWNAEKLQAEYPHLNLGQIYSALAYYWDHREILEAEIQRREAIVQELEQWATPSPFVARIKVEGRLAQAV